jgi:hypothetical protein
MSQKLTCSAAPKSARIIRAHKRWDVIFGVLGLPPCRWAS